MTQNPFLHSLQSFQHNFASISKKEDTLLLKKEALKKSLEQIFKVKNSNLNENSPLVKMADELHISIINSFKNWDIELENYRPMKLLSELYSDRIIFLVFGKVNAGKSSFSNFITDLFPEEQIKRFQFHDGKIQFMDKRFAEGVTETTAFIQGVELGQNLVLLDSPGLHSVTDCNGELTRRFTDSTDAILWLTPSTSPGQVQELADLKDELAKKKPLLPIITRSDELIESGWNDVTDSPISSISNKTTENRKLQEEDVIHRLKEYKEIESTELKKAISISIHAYKSSDKETSDLQEAGLSNLYQSLSLIIEEAKVYKIRKAHQQMINFLDKKVLSSLTNEISPTIRKLKKETKNTIENINRQKKYLVSEITAAVICEISDIVNRHKDSQNKKAIATELNILIEEKINNTLQKELSQYITELKRTNNTLSIVGLGEFEAITIDIKQVKGSATKTVAATAGTIGGGYGGALLGNLIPIPGIGPFIGYLLGSLFGGAAGSTAGDIFVETEVITKNVGISSEKIIKTITDNIKKSLPKIIDVVFVDVIEKIQPVENICISIEQIIQQFSIEIDTLKG